MLQRYHKRVPKEQKFNILSEHFEKGTPISELARLHGIHPITIYQWKRNMGEKPEDKLDIQKLIEENNQLKKEKKHLTKAIGELALDNQILKDLNEFLKKRKREQELKKQEGSLKKKKGPTRR